MTVTTKEQDTQSQLNRDIPHIVEIVISRDDLIHGRFNKLEKFVQEKPTNEIASVNHNKVIVEFLNSIYESILQEETGGLTK